ncbi:hypothetical protein B6U74_01650 [Candidatus Bathyarchaeota archaeon ex4484_205]|nr:MAG: hypothetical protein B6U74_01650 [Candidatus Bathyarchaeota archaeon ex4484_205]RLG67711.1 MAG: hypothetical protein DRN93_04020 [archaeon]HDN17440.1 hypothetical protein [Candidatus Bathyarchaeota archaeon]
MMWRTRPLKNAILEIVSRKGATTLTSLMNELKKTYNEFSQDEVLDALMRLEVRGKITVTELGRDNLRIELAR